jgi:hypothetical protein
MAHQHNLVYIALKLEKMILANMGCYQLQAIPWVKTTSPVLELRDA